MNLPIVRAATREVLEAYMAALRNGDLQQALFWRAYVVERLELLSEYVGDSTGPSGTDQAQ